MAYFIPTNNYTNYTANGSGSVSNDFITLRITVAIPDKIVVVIVLIKTTYFMGSDREDSDYHDHSNFMYKTPGVGGYHVAHVINASLNLSCT